MNTDELEQIQAWYQTGKEATLYGRWLPFSKIEPLLQGFRNLLQVSKIGASINKLPIYKVQIGNGPIKILIWSQMHGNESTGTKAVFDLFNLFLSPGAVQPMINHILTQCTITVIPMLNPDGAQAYTRVNAAGIDLNRDAVDLKSPESHVLRAVLETFRPAYCFNLHDQRTIYTVGATKMPATLSFLAPATNASREITEGRKETMRVIVAMNQVMQQLIKGCIGRYTDEFYPKATGDNFQKEGYNTILIEAGHAINDYEREKVRYYNFVALLCGLQYIAANEVVTHQSYFDIPNNTTYFLDIIYQHIHIASEGVSVDVGVLFKEELQNGEIVFKPEIEIVGDLKLYNANKIIDKTGMKVFNREQLREIINN